MRAGVCLDHGDGFSSSQFSSRFSMNSYLLTIHQQPLGFLNAYWATQDRYLPLDRHNLHLAGGNQEERFIGSSNRSCWETSSRSCLDSSHRSKPPARHSEALAYDSDEIFGCQECFSPPGPNFLVQASWMPLLLPYLISFGRIQLPWLSFGSGSTRESNHYACPG